MDDMMKLIERINDPELERALVMGILNVTPDSFSDGGRFIAQDAIKLQVEKMISAGVDIIDVGGESTRPGASVVTLQEELDRTQSVIEWIKTNHDCYVSIDTYKPEVMASSIALGVDLINDVNALQADGALQVVSEAAVPVCLMHKQGEPNTMQLAPDYDDVVEEVIAFLNQRVRIAEQSGIAKHNIIIDPGFGFGKNLSHNIRLFEELDRVVDMGLPVLVGVSRKKMIGQILSSTSERPVSERMVGSVAAALLAQLKGAKILRVHDVQETSDALKVAMALL